ncbi:ATP-dependent DNA helicase pfh1-like [Cotesia glomerata]|uniref:ATP-dependent DNA helicase pfh1-like n=1 Tax=Cotesia glomerata TaxID=32391 RepID=UPI001D02D643|nr:ATP-dependent DNA helicase pfh1-like [Cotesia glomerata]
MEVYNRFSDNDGFCNSYITCASTDKAPIAINGTTVHTALKISLSKLIPLSIETAQQYRCLFKYVKVLIIDEISMIGAELLNQIDARLKQKITGNFDENFGGLDIIFIGDLRQLPPVRATPIYKQSKQQMIGPLLWRGLKFYELTQIMRQDNEMFASILIKIGSGIILNDDELAVIESRFFTKEEALRLCPSGVRLFHDNASVNAYNVLALQTENKIDSIAMDIISGCTNHEQEANIRQKLHKLSVIDTGGLPYEIIFVIGKPYIITTNIDVVDGLANGTVGKLVHIEQNDENQITRIWLVFPDKNTGMVARRKAAAFLAEHNIDRRAVPIVRRTSSIPLNNNKTIVGKRNHFPLISGCAMTIHKSQGDESVDLPNFHCIAEFKRQNVRAAGVAIYKNNNTSHITTFNMDLVIQNATEVHASQTSIGDICASHQCGQIARFFYPFSRRRARPYTSKRCVSVSRKAERSRENPRHVDKSRGMKPLPQDTEE